MQKLNRWDWTPGFCKGCKTLKNPEFRRGGKLYHYILLPNGDSGDEIGNCGPIGEAPEKSNG